MIASTRYYNAATPPTSLTGKAQSFNNQLLSAGLPALEYVCMWVGLLLVCTTVCMSACLSIICCSKRADREQGTS